MNFTSVLFPPLFFGILLLYDRLAKERRPLLLLAASWLFYLCTGPCFFPVLLLVTLAAWLSGRAMDAADRTEDQREKPASGTGRRRLFLLAGLLPILGLFLSLKYLHLTPEAVPGISFYAFQTSGYCIDVYRGRLRAERSFLQFALFVSFFPQLVAGPIEQGETLLPQLTACPTPGANARRRALARMLWGYVKKLAIADYLAVFADRAYGAGTFTGPVVLGGTLLFAMQIYADFSGYSDIAVGAAGALGIRLTQNFDRPYLSASPREFWRRWHITLGQWFSRYVYIPLGGNRRGPLRHAANILTVFVLSGFWHGAALHFGAWGLYHGVLYLMSQWVEGRFTNKNREKSAPRLPARCLTFVLVVFGWIFFRAPSLAAAWAMIRHIPAGWDSITFGLTPQQALCILLGPVLLLLGEPLLMRLVPAGDTADPDTQALPLRYLTWFLLLLTALFAWMTQLAGGAENAFIYFQF